jgi:hypothetical protein
LHASTARGIGGSDGCGHAAGGSIVARYFMLTKVYYRVRWPSATRSKGLCMHLTRLSAITFLLSVFLSAHAFGETLGDARVGFSAERILVVDGRRYVGRMWHMPGEQRHEQELPAINPVFILHAGSAQGDVVLPQLHTVVEFALPKEFAILANPDLLRRPIGQETVNGIETTKYTIEQDLPGGHIAGSLWLSRDGIPMRCDGKFEPKNGRRQEIYWELRSVKLGKQDEALFELPQGYAKLPPEAAAPFIGMHLAAPPAH